MLQKALTAAACTCRPLHTQNKVLQVSFFLLGMGLMAPWGGEQAAQQRKPAPPVPAVPDHSPALAACCRLIPVAILQTMDYMNAEFGVRGAAPAASSASSRAASSAAGCKQAASSCECLARQQATHTHCTHPVCHPALTTTTLHSRSTRRAS